MSLEDPAKQAALIHKCLERGLASFLGTGSFELFVGWAALIEGTGSDSRVSWVLVALAPLLLIGLFWGASSIDLWHRLRKGQGSNAPRWTGCVVLVLQIPNLIFILLMMLAYVGELFMP